ncbi:MAG: hypothetical protein A2Y25_05350 [Candidatus Melainabacteria bacterium GWF2_37_15]|nr:MAG: hypothetical protein A2Y25_05350 [Candidatus Melainabacteria bacterium GWF2_37_15]
MLITPNYSNTYCFNPKKAVQTVTYKKEVTSSPSQKQIFFGADNSLDMWFWWLPSGSSSRSSSRSESSSKSESRTMPIMDKSVMRNKVTFDDIGGLSKKTLEEIKIATQATLIHPEIFTAVDVNPEKNIILVSPPGCGKTMIAQAIANENQCNFISIKPSDLRGEFISNTEKNISKLFKEAREKAPCIIFIDEMEGLTAMRKANSTSNHDNIALNQLLMEIQGINGNNKGVRIIGATNRLDMVDDAIKRDGRFDYIIEIPMPDKKGCEDVFKKVNKRRTIEEGLDLSKFSTKLSGLSPASIKALSDEAATNCLRRSGILEKALQTNDPINLKDYNLTLTKLDFEKALKTVEERNNLRKGNAASQTNLAH